MLWEQTAKRLTDIRSPLLNKKTNRHRDAVVYGWFGAGATITGNGYTYHTSWDANDELYEYSANMLYPVPDAVSGHFIPGVDCPVWKMPRRCIELKPYPELLFDRKSDIKQENNIISQQPGIRKSMRDLLRGEMESEGVPAEQYKRLMLYINQI